MTRNEDVNRQAASHRERLTDEDLRLLVWCALDFERRLPDGLIPGRIWEMLSVESRSLINRWKDGHGRDQLGAEVRR